MESSLVTEGCNHKAQACLPQTAAIIFTKARQWKCHVIRSISIQLFYRRVSGVGGRGGERVPVDKIFFNSFNA